MQIKNPQAFEKKSKMVFPLIHIVNKGLKCNLKCEFFNDSAKLVLELITLVHILFTTFHRNKKNTQHNVFPKSLYFTLNDICLLF